MSAPRARITTRPGSPGSRISGLGHFRPDRVVNNEELSLIMDTNDEWIRSRVGIAERRFGGEDDSVVSMGARASAKALAEAGLQPTDIDTIIVATCSLNSPVPHAATQIAGALGIPAPGTFDLNAACAGFCYGIAAADQAVRTGASTNVLVVGSERLTGALLDRLTHHVHILEMNGDSYRLNQSKHRSRRTSSDTPADNPTQA